MKIARIGMALSVLLLLCSATVYGAAETVKLEWPGKSIVFDTPPQIIDGRTMVPMRPLMEALGYNVMWRAEENVPYCQKDDIIITLKMNSKSVIKSSVYTDEKTTLSMDTPPVNRGGRILVPLRFLVESEGLVTTWNADTRTVVVRDPVEEAKNKSAEADNQKYNGMIGAWECETWILSIAPSVREKGKLQAQFYYNNGDGFYSEGLIEPIYGKHTLKQLDYDKVTITMDIQGETVMVVGDKNFSKTYGNKMTLKKTGNKPDPMFIEQALDQ